MTNYEIIKAMDIDELAHLLEDDCYYCVCYPATGSCSLPCKEGVKKWLESEAEIDDIIPNAATGERQINNKTE